MGQATLRTYGEANGARLLSPLLGVGYMGQVRIRDFPPCHSLPRLQWGRIALPAIVRFLRSFPHAMTADAP